MYILSLTDTRHDEGSIAFFQLRWQGFTVVDRQCPRVGSAQSSGLHSNHGGLAVISISSIQLRLLNIDFISTTFEYLATQVYLRKMHQYIYSTGPVRKQFSSELSELHQLLSVIIHH